MKEKITVEILNKAIERLKKYQAKPDKDGMITIEVENPKEKTDFLRVIDERELNNYKLVTDNKGDTKQVYVKPTLLLF